MRARASNSSRKARTAKDTPKRSDVQFGNGVEPVLRKYRELSEKYRHLVEKFESRSAHQAAVHTLAWWAVRSTASAVALFQNGKIVVANSRWNALNRVEGRNRKWQLLSESTVPDGRRTLGEAVAATAGGIGGKGGKPLMVERYYRGRPEQTVEVRYELLTNSTRRTRMVAVMAHDVTERVRTERELSEARTFLLRQEHLRTIGELASGVAHDLNNALNAIRLRLATLRSDSGFVAAHGSELEALARIVTDTAERIGRLQDFAHTRLQPPRESFSLRRVIDEALEIARPEIEGKSSLAGIGIEVIAALEDLPPVIGIAGELRHVFLNLLLNARDAMHAGGTIEVGATVEAERVIVTFADQGGGISEEHLPRIFEPFFTTKGRRGTGLGLSTAQAIMARLGGSISVANRRPTGAVFTLGFPIARPKPAQREVPSAAEPPPPRRVLLIDDDSDNLESMKLLLESLGSNVDAVPGGAEAFERIRAGANYDLVLCDVGMPAMNGWQAAEHILKIAPNANLYMLTGWAEEIASNDPRCKLVRAVLSKPIDLERINKLLVSPGGSTPELSARLA